MVCGPCRLRARVPAARSPTPSRYPTAVDWTTASHSRIAAGWPIAARWVLSMPPSRAPYPATTRSPKGLRWSSGRRLRRRLTLLHQSRISGSFARGQAGSALRAAKAGPAVAGGAETAVEVMAVTGALAAKAAAR